MKLREASLLVSITSPLNKQKIILDTGPLIYLLLYNYSELEDINVQDRVNKVSGHEFSKKNSQLLAQKLSGKELFVTSHTLAEVSNHVESDSKYNIPVKEFLESNSDFINENVEEEHLSIKRVLESHLGLNFGIPDCSINELLEKESFTLVSSDEEIMEGAGREGHSIMPLGSLLIEP